MSNILDKLDYYQSIAEAATKGPWRWAGHPESLRLCTTHGGQRFVMTFVRRGMRDAQPCFQVKGEGMVNAADLLQFDVGDQSVVGVKGADKDPSVYRTDIRGIAHPDAIFMAEFNPEVALALIAELRAVVAEFANVSA